MSLASSSVTILPRVHGAARATRRASPVTNASWAKPGLIVRSGVNFDPLRVLARRRASPRALTIRASASEPPASNTRRPASELERIASASGDLNPLKPCGACKEWLLKIAEVNPGFKVLMFSDVSCDDVYIKNVSQC